MKALFTHVILLVGITAVYAQRITLPKRWRGTQHARLRTYLGMVARDVDRSLVMIKKTAVAMASKVFLNSIKAS